MDIQIQSIHFPPSEALNDKIEMRLKKAFEHYSYITKGHVFLKVQENDPKANRIMEIRLGLPHAELFAETRDNNLYHALDENIYKLKRQLEKYKQKVYTSP